MIIICTQAKETTFAIKKLKFISNCSYYDIPYEMMKSEQTILSINDKPWKFTHTANLTQKVLLTYSLNQKI